MSDSDSFIDEVNEELRRDRFFHLLRRYGWIAVAAILLIVGAAALNEYFKAQERAAAEALGDSILSAMEANDTAARLSGLESVTPEDPGADMVVRFLRAGELAESGDIDAARAELEAIATNGDLALIYRQLAQFKSLTMAQDALGIEERRIGFEALAADNVPLQLLAEEQLAYLDIESGDAASAIGRLNALLANPEATPGLQQRAVQVIVALGEEPDLDALLPADTGDQSSN